MSNDMSMVEIYKNETGGPVIVDLTDKDGVTFKTYNMADGDSLLVRRILYDIFGYKVRVHN